MADSASDTSSTYYHLARVIRSNDPPTREEREEASQILWQMDIGLNALEHEISALQAALSQLQLRHAALKERRDGQIAPILSPWRRLPPELWSIIFQFAVNPGWSNTFSPSTNSTDRSTFQSLRAVCRMWREVAFSTRSLWTNVWVDAGRADVLTDVQGYLQRAGPSLPLELGFKWSQLQQIPDPWMNYLFSQRSRLTTLAVHTYGHLFYDLEERLKQANGGGWATRHLSVGVDGSLQLQTSAPSNPNVMNTCFPMLESLHFSYTSGNTYDTILLNGHSNLRKLFLCMIPVDPNVYFSKLGRFSNLRELTLIMTAFVELPNSVPICSLPLLRDLTIRNICSFRLFAKMQTPSLRSLHVSTAFPPRTRSVTVRTIQNRLWQTFHQLLTFLQNFGSNIEDLYLRCGFLQDNDALRNLLESIPTVQTLCLDTWFIDGPEPDSETSPSSSGDTVEEHGATTPDPEAQALPESASILPQLRKICLHPPEQNPHLHELPHLTPFVRSPAYWRSFLGFLRSRNESNTQTSGDVLMLHPGFGSGVGSSMAGFEQGSSTGGMGGIGRPNLVVCLPDLEGLQGVLDAGQMQAAQSVRDFDGAFVSIETVRSCDTGR
ncbi:hypothetical protein MD484_g2337, partial [Candolleomyces efflorescens]